MATYFARKTGNVNATDVWATTPSGTASNLFPTFTNADVLMANSFTITLNVNTTVAEIRNDATGGATAGGSFIMSDGVTLTANVYGGTATLATLTANPTASQFIVGNLYGGTGGSASAHAVFNTLNTGTLQITGNLIGGAGLAAGTCALSMSSANVVVSGNVTGASNTSFGAGEGIRMTGAGNCTVTGNVTGGAHATNYGVRVTGAGNITIVGQAIGGNAASAINNESTGQVAVTRAVGNGFGGGSVGLSAAVGVSNVVSQSSITIVEQMEFGTLGQSPVNGRIRLKKLSSNVAVFNYCDTAGAKTLIDATANAAMPAATDVRDGVSYASGALTGTCKVPAAASTAFGVPVDATTGTAVLTPAAIRTELSVELGRIDAAISSRLAPSGTLATVTTLTNAPTSVTPTDIWTHATRTITGGTVDTLTNAPTVPTAAAIADEVRVELAAELARIDAPVSSASAPTASTVATAVRTELTAELAHLDADISTRATPADIPASDITAIKTTTDALNTDRLAQVSTVATTGSQLAAALS
jgi:hypothetical protein